MNHRVAVQLDIDTFVKIEETLENYGLTQIIEMLEPDDEILDLDQAKAYYQSLQKTQ